MVIRTSKSFRRIMIEISTENLERLLVQSQHEIDKQLGRIIAQIARQDHAAWSEFPARMLTHSERLREQAERLSEGRSL